MKAIAVIACLLLVGCTAPTPVILATGNVDRLIAHPEFKAAAIAAPNFTSDALNAVAKLEHDLAIK